MPPAHRKIPPAQHNFATVNGLVLHVAEVGAGIVPMVLLHGIGMDWRVWQATSRRLFDTFHLYMVDLRGHGDSGKPTHGYSLAHYAADIEDYVDQMELKGAVIVGSSLGGMVAATVEVPADVVSHRILVDPPLTGGPVRNPEMYRDILSLKHQPERMLTDYLHRMNPGVGRMYSSIMSEMWHNAADGVIQDMLAYPQTYFDIDSGLRLNESNTLIMRADSRRGGVLTEPMALRAANMLARAKVVFIPGSGHAIHATHPADFVSSVEQFVGITH